jgi:hypothetical protein
VLARFSRQEFLKERWAHQPGEQVLVIAPTQAGKTRLLYELAANVDHQKPPIVCVMKPQDPTPAEMNAKYGYREIATWPPSKRHFWQEPDVGLCLWPRHNLSLDPASLERTNKHLKRQFESAMMGSYKGGHQVVIADEVYGFTSELGMSPTIIALITRGSGMGTSLWTGAQQPKGTQTGGSLPGQIFSSPTHLFLGQSPESRDRKRFSEIGGINTDLVRQEVDSLQSYPVQTPQGMKYASQFLYISKSGPSGGYMAVIEPW